MMTDNPRATLNGTLQFVTSAMLAYTFTPWRFPHIGILVMNGVDVELQLFHVPIPALTKVPTVHVKHDSIPLHGRKQFRTHTG